MSLAQHYSINAQIGDKVTVTDYFFGTVKGEYVGEVIRTTKTGITIAYNGTAARFTVDGRKMGGDCRKYSHARKI